MSDGFEWAEEIDPADYGRWRGEQERARQEASAKMFTEMLDGAGQAQHQAAHDHLTRSTHGILGAMTGQQAAQDVTQRQVIIGQEYGGRPLEYNGHLAESIGPRPARVWASQITDRPGFQVDNDRPILRHLRGER